MRRNVYINYPIASLHGWGVYGLNLALAWATDPDIAPICPRPIDLGSLALDPLRRQILGLFFKQSSDLVAELKAHAGQAASVGDPVLTYLEHDFVLNPAAHEVTLQGQPTIGAVFFETARLAPDAVERAKALPLIVTGSTWNAEVLRAHGLNNVTTVLQGVDPTLFHTAPRSGFVRDRFLVFSGGKLERRKGQDLALAAFARFAAKRPDALLVTAWHCPWPEFARSLDVSGIASPVPFGPDGRVAVAAWARANGIAPTQILDLGALPNFQLPPILRDMDAAIFPNRAEGGTNLVAMECMACGTPTVLSRNTGHLDLIEEGNCFTLDRQKALEGSEGPLGDVPGWGESDVDEIVDALERIYLDREAARARGLAGAETLKRLSWRETARRMKALVLATDTPAR